MCIIRFLFSMCIIMKTIVISSVLFLLLVTHVFAAAWPSDRPDDYHIFLYNTVTQEEKYLDYRASVFENYTTRILVGSKIGGKTPFSSRELKRIELRGYNVDEWTMTHGFYLTWTLQWAGSSLSIKEYYESFHTMPLRSDVSHAKKFSWDDFDDAQKRIMFLKILWGYTWWSFFIFLPLNLLAFSCIAYPFYLFSKKLHWKVFDNIYINSFFIYVLVEIFLIYNKLSELDCSIKSIPSLASYYLLAWMRKIILIFASLHIIQKHNKAHPQQKIYLEYVGYFYLVSLAIFIAFWTIIGTIKNFMWW